MTRCFREHCSNTGKLICLICISLWECLYKLLTENKWEDCPAISHFDRPCLGGHGSGWVCSGGGGSQGASCQASSSCTVRTPGSYPPWMGWIYRLGSEAPFLWWMPTGPEAFLERRHFWVTALHPDPPKNALYYSHPVDGTVNKYSSINLCTLRSAVLGELGSGRVLFTNPSARAGYDTRSIFKRSLTGFEFRVFLLLD